MAIIKPNMTKEKKSSTVMSLQTCVHFNSWTHHSYIS